MRLTLVLLHLSLLVSAQETNYLFEHYTQEYNDLENPISINNNLIWDEPGYEIPVGFEYELFNHTANSIIFHYNMGGAVLFISDNEGFERIVVNQADMADRAFNGINEGEAGSLSPISYQHEEKIFKLEWKSAGIIGFHYTYFMNFQLWIYERSNVIEIHYGPSNFPEGMEYSCGLLEYYWLSDKERGFIVEETQNGHELEVLELDDPTYPSGTEPFSNPVDGTVFRFTPTLENSFGVEEMKSAIQIYPNPTTDFLYIENNEQENTEYELVSIDGCTLKKGKSSDKKIQVDLSNLNPGMYLLQVEKNGNIFSKNISKL